jgi:hypothetical protein
VLINVSVFRKSFHTDKYLLYKSRSHVNDEKAVVKILLDRPKTIPTNSALQTQETAKMWFKVPMQRNFTERFLDCIAKII